MVAIVTGNGLGLERNSANVLGARGQIGSANLGRSNESVHINAATGNLILSNRDELLIGRRPDSAINRTYNSLGAYTGLDGTTADADNWWMNSQRKIALTSGSLNETNSIVTLTDWDGSSIVFTFDSPAVGYQTQQAADSPYRDNKLIFTPLVGSTHSFWTWTEGKSRRVETFESLHTS